MRSRRIAISIAVALTASIVAVPAAAGTSTLLSGYGGPGQGNQAILGSTLLKRGGGPGGRSSSGSSRAEDGSAASSEAGTEEPSLVATETSPRPEGGSSSEARRVGPVPGTDRKTSAKHSRTSAERAERPTVASASLYPTSEHLAPGQQDATLGLSGADLIYALVGAALLASLGFLTRRMSEFDGRGSGG